MADADEHLMAQLRLVRKYLKFKLLEDNVTFRGFAKERAHLHNLMSATIEKGVANSAVIVGPRGSGKTTMVNSVLHELTARPHFQDDVIVVKLCGLQCNDDKIALRSITKQMGLDNVVGDRIFGSFSENFAYLLDCLRSGGSLACKSMVFVMDEFHHFCHANAAQTLLYNLFDVAHNQLAPICIIGITCRLNFMDLLEKRIKSRFSQLHIFLFPREEAQSKEDTIVLRVKLFRRLLSLPTHFAQPTSPVSVKVRRDKTHSKRAVKDNDLSNLLNCVQMTDDTRGDNLMEIPGVPECVLERCNSHSEEFAKLDPVFVSLWNEHIRNLAEDKAIVAALERQYHYSVNEKIFRDTLLRMVARLSPNLPRIEPFDVQAAVSRSLDDNGKVFLIQSVSVLELSLLIAMKHQSKIFDGQPMNFEMVLNRYTKFANANSSSQVVPRPVALKAFEHLRDLELIASFSTGAFGYVASRHSRTQKEYRLYSLGVTEDQLNMGIRAYRNLPTEICQWILNSVV